MSGSTGVGPRVRQLLLAGLGHRAIRRQLGVSSSTVSHHRKALGIARKSRPTYDWTLIQEFYDQGATVEQCAKHFRCKRETIFKAMKDGRLRRRPAPQRYIPAAQYGDVIAGKAGWANRFRMKTKLLKESILKYACGICGISEWRGEPLTLRLDHIDGDGGNFSVVNLRLLCPNCDSQQDTFCHRNIGRAAKLKARVEERQTQRA